MPKATSELDVRRHSAIAIRNPPSSPIRFSTRIDTETEMLRYLRKLESRDLSLTTLDDPARVVHDEAERDGGDVPDFVAGIREAASVRA